MNCLNCQKNSKYLTFKAIDGRPGVLICPNCKTELMIAPSDKSAFQSNMHIAFTIALGSFFGLIMIADQFFKGQHFIRALFAFMMIAAFLSFIPLMNYLSKDIDLLVFNQEIYDKENFKEQNDKTRAKLFLIDGLITAIFFLYFTIKAAIEILR